MRTLTISAAVAGILASAAASAATVDLYVSGASAQRTFWKNDMVASVCGANAQTTWTVTGAAANPDDQAWRCLADGTLTLPTGIAGGDTVTIHYSAELGSISGISPFLNTTSLPTFTGNAHRTTRLFVNPDSADCGATTCTIATYDVGNETFTSTNGTALVDRVPDVGATDADPVKWASADNWLDVTNFPAWAGAGSSLPTSADLQTFQSSANNKVVNGQVFSLIVNNTNPIAAKGNISKASATAIFTGQYATWGQVPEVGGGDATPIKVCRRDHGSGTETSSSIFFTGTECGQTGASRFVSATANNGLPAKFGSLANPGGVEEQNTTGKLTACVTGTTGAIGFRSVAASANYTTLTVDGVAANAHNAAGGFYPFAYETWVFNNTSASGAAAPAVNLFTTLFTNARRAAKLPAESGSQAANGQWTTTAPQSAYALPGGGFGNTKSVANWVTTAQGTTGLGFRSGNSCTLLINTNAT